MFQPIVDVVANRVTSFEALARWTSPTLGRVSPADFIPMAERLGLVEAITTVLFTKACAVARLWPDTIRLSFNLSGEDLAGPDPVARLSRMVAGAGLAPDRLIFEVTETAVIQDFGSATACLQAAAGSRLPHRARRFRHGLLQPELRARAAARQAQDRRQLRARAGRRPAPAAPSCNRSSTSRPSSASNAWSRAWRRRRKPTPCARWDASPCRAGCSVRPVAEADMRPRRLPSGRLRPQRRPAGPEPRPRPSLTLPQP